MEWLAQTDWSELLGVGGVGVIAYLILQWVRLIIGERAEIGRVYQEQSERLADELTSLKIQIAESRKAEKDCHDRQVSLEARISDQEAGLYAQAEQIRRLKRLLGESAKIELEGESEEVIREYHSRRIPRHSDDSPWNSGQEI